MPKSGPKVAILDFELGNLFSVAQACRVVGLTAEITDDPRIAADADALIVPGVGSFPRAMAVLKRRGLISAIQDTAARNKPVIGVCLGLQLFMEGSTEFGHTDGLGLIAGEALRLPDIPAGNGRNVPIPNVGWCAVAPPNGEALWRGSPLADIKPNAAFYFVHSYYVKPTNAGEVLANSMFGSFEFCAAVRCGSVFGFQFHPERSGPTGLAVYRSVRHMIEAARMPV
jgi:imidazole glycerol-phosphate synthase subunit HisH